MKEKNISDKQVKVQSIISFSIFIIAFTAGIFAWKILRPESKKDISKPLRKTLLFNESVFSKIFDQDKLVKTYPKSEAVSRVRVNGREGLRSPMDSAGWHLQVVKKNGDTMSFTMEDIKKLPKTEVVFDFKCIEGWSQKTWWGGVKFSDFVNFYHLNDEVQMNYAGMMTPDRGYYVGLDMKSLMQPQTILCYEMNGKELPLDQGYPLRLIIPVKYGIKHIKRIGTVYFSNLRPPDFWAERGYDYYAGH